MPTTKFYVLLVKDRPLRSCVRLFLEDGTPLRGLVGYTFGGNSLGTASLTLEFNNAELIHIDKPPTTQSEFYSPTFPPGVKPARVGPYLARTRAGDDWFILKWGGARWFDSRGRPFAKGQPYYWRGLAFDPLSRKT